jgi:glycerol-3-phosphate O-acyltransferase
VNLETNYQQVNPWPPRDGQQVLFILDARNSLEQAILKGWIHHHSPSRSDAFNAPQVCLDLGEDRKGFDTAQLVRSLALPPDTVIAPLRVAWLPSKQDINSGPRVRNLLFGDPRRPSARRARKILRQAPERMHLIAGAPDSMNNLSQRFEHHHSLEDGEAQQDFADFVARQAAVVLDIAERRLQGGRYKVPRHVAANLMANPDYSPAVARISTETGKTQAELMQEAAGYMDERRTSSATRRR